MAHPALVQAFRLDGVITLVDAVNGAGTLDAHVEAVKQVAVADRIVLTKADLVTDPGEVEALRARLRRINPGAELLGVDDGQAGAAALIDCGLYNPATKSADARRWLGEATHDHHHDHPLIIPSYQWKLCLAVFSISYQESLSLYDFCF